MAEDAFSFSNSSLRKNLNCLDRHFDSSRGTFSDIMVVLPEP